MSNKFFFSIGLITILSASGCANFPGMSGSSDDPNAPGHGTALTEYNDPDGDGDTKGANYFPLVRQPTGRRIFIFDPDYRAWALYDQNGERLNTGKASGGQDFCEDVNRPCRTITGSFRVLSKDGEDCKSSIFPLETNGGAPMPYCMRFTYSGYAVHGSYDVPDYNASHGCVRVTPTAAKWLSDYMSIGTQVIILPY